MLVGLVVWGLGVEEYLDAVREADRLGFSSFSIGDHFEVGKPVDSWEPYLLMTLAQ